MGMRPGRHYQQEANMRRTSLTMGCAVAVLALSGCGDGMEVPFENEALIGGDQAPAQGPEGDVTALARRSGAR